jgi:hypothetical protein
MQQSQIATELKELKLLLSKIVGSSDLPSKEQFSPQILDKAAKEFKKLSIARGEWITEYELYKHFKDAHYGCGKFIREKFGFSNYFKQGKTTYYNKTDIVSLSKELKLRNVNLARYMELKQDQENFKKKLVDASSNKKASKLKKSYQLPDDLYDINTSEPPRPAIELVKEDIKNLEEEFFQYKLADYIDIYKGNYAMVKFEYSFSKYLNNEIKQRCRKWCENFNYANHALELLTNKKASFIPVKEDDMIQL